MPFPKLAYTSLYFGLYIRLRSLCITESNLGFDVLERLVFCTPNLLHLDLSSTDINDFSPIAHLRQLRTGVVDGGDSEGGSDSQSIFIIELRMEESG
ncbi:unnamed protein product [Gongylonema pulchrum]|uniref:F-box/LRR-repeat protein n=1 Tax=Gongylonema pulchrum TaxID=637853 RepID=A0A183D6M8_9BILA|nr:unnamed protein product [Gongylonema pulchrum]